MAKRSRSRPRAPDPHSSATNQLLFVIVLILLVGVAFLAYRFWKQQQHPPAPPAPPTPQAAQTTTTPTNLVSDNRIIFGGMPRPRTADLQPEIFQNDAYIVGYSETRKDPLWSAYRVIHTDHPYHLERPRGPFLTDFRTRARVAHHDFTGSGFDRGHMTPNSAIARCFGEEAQRQTFLLSNICPQAPALNQKVWEKLEMDEIDYADHYGEIWVMDGPIFADLNGGTTRTLRSGIAVPTAFYKILVDDHTGTPRVFAVIMPQTVRGTEQPRQYLTSIQEIEKETQLDFLWKLPAQEQAQLKDKVWPMW